MLLRPFVRLRRDYAHRERKQMIDPQTATTIADITVAASLALAMAILIVGFLVSRD